MEYKIVLVGSAEVGKTFFIKKLLKIRYFAEQNYIPTLGVDVYPLNINTNHGLIRFNIWDCAGDLRFTGLSDGYYLGANACIIMVDNNIQTLNSIEQRKNSVQLITGQIPIITIINKCDLIQENNDIFEQYQAYTNANQNVMTISVKNDDLIDLYEPIIYLVEQLTGFNDIVILE